MKKIKIKSFCKVNLFLKVLNKSRDGKHNIKSLVTFCELHDVISIKKINSSRDKINFSGKFKDGINNKSNTITKLLFIRLFKLSSTSFFDISRHSL